MKRIIICLIMVILATQIVLGVDTTIQEDLSSNLRLELDYEYSCSSDKDISISHPTCIPTNTEYIFCAISEPTCKFPRLYEELNENIYIHNGRFIILICLALFILRKKRVI